MGLYRRASHSADLGASGPVFGFSEPWQLIINSFTTIVTFLMVFIIQNTQNRDFKSMQIKLDACWPRMKMFPTDS